MGNDFIIEISYVIKVRRKEPISRPIPFSLARSDEGIHLIDKTNRRDLLVLPKIILTLDAGKRSDYRVLLCTYDYFNFNAFRRILWLQLVGFLHEGGETQPVVQELVALLDHYKDELLVRYG